MYSVITNNTDAVRTKIESVAGKIGGIKGLTSSVDPVICDPTRQGTDVWLKSINGLNNLIDQKNRGIGKDVVAEITVDSTNIQWLPQLVGQLADHDIQSDITFIDLKKNPYYDFSGVTDTSLLVYPTPQVKDIIEKTISDNPDHVLFPDILRKTVGILPGNLRCEIHNDVHNLTLAPDGSIRLCLRIRGVSTPKVSFDEAFDAEGNIKPALKEAMRKDYERYCMGCNWPCVLMSKYFANQEEGQ